MDQDINLVEGSGLECQARVTVGSSSKDRKVGRGDRKGEERMYTEQVCPWLQYVLELYTLHNSTDLMVFE